MLKNSIARFQYIRKSWHKVILPALATVLFLGPASYGQTTALTGVNPDYKGQECVKQEAEMQKKCSVSRTGRECRDAQRAVARMCGVTIGSECRDSMKEYQKAHAKFTSACMSNGRFGGNDQECLRKISMCMQQTRPLTPATSTNGQIPMVQINDSCPQYAVQFLKNLEDSKKDALDKYKDSNSDMKSASEKMSNSLRDDQKRKAELMKELNESRIAAEDAQLGGEEAQAKFLDEIGAERAKLLRQIAAIQNALEKMLTADQDLINVQKAKALRGEFDQCHKQAVEKNNEYHKNLRSLANTGNDEGGKLKYRNFSQQLRIQEMNVKEGPQGFKNYSYRVYYTECVKDRSFGDRIKSIKEDALSAHKARAQGIKEKQLELDAIKEELQRLEQSAERKATLLQKKITAQIQAATSKTQVTMNEYMEFEQVSARTQNQSNIEFQSAQIKFQRDSQLLDYYEQQIFAIKQRDPTLSEKNVERFEKQVDAYSEMTAASEGRRSACCEDDKTAIFGAPAEMTSYCKSKPNTLFGISLPGLGSYGGLRN